MVNTVGSLDFDGRCVCPNCFNLEDMVSNGCECPVCDTKCEEDCYEKQVQKG